VANTLRRGRGSLVAVLSCAAIGACQAHATTPSSTAATTSGSPSASPSSSASATPDANIALLTATDRLRSDLSLVSGKPVAAAARQAHNAQLRAAKAVLDYTKQLHYGCGASHAAADADIRALRSTVSTYHGVLATATAAKGRLAADASAVANAAKAAKADIPSTTTLVDGALKQYASYQKDYASKAAYPATFQSRLYKAYERCVAKRG
jgi:hypothetical protein